ncbi:hypothetical protein RF11_02518 [Thelohanellus kitauei]|uniref:Uncharacterized protein n=1 Tax=Thelohanellus kitauei TaxID=669202 RepID=A0A0C2NMH1_THEKT|nr:hypothetical protein RF11_02518 [Thelohanellus kitauei]
MMITEDFTHPVFDEICELIIRLPPDTPLLLIKTSCEFLYHMIRHHSKGPSMTKISFYSIYKWLEHLPTSVSNVVLCEKESGLDLLNDVVSACNFINHITLLCRQSDQVKNLVRVMRDETSHASGDDQINVLSRVYEVLMVELFQVSCF